MRLFMCITGMLVVRLAGVVWKTRLHRAEESKTNSQSHSYNLRSPLVLKWQGERTTEGLKGALASLLFKALSTHALALVRDAEPQFPPQA